MTSTKSGISSLIPFSSLKYRFCWFIGPTRVRPLSPTRNCPPPPPPAPHGYCCFGHCAVVRWPFLLCPLFYHSLIVRHLRRGHASQSSARLPNQESQGQICVKSPARAAPLAEAPEKAFLVTIYHQNESAKNVFAST